MLNNAIKRHFSPGFIIERPNRTTKDTGSTTTTYGQTGTVNGILIKSRSSSLLNMLMGQLQTKDGYTFYCGAGEDIKKLDRITDQQGRQYEVQNVTDPQGRGEFLKADLEVWPNEI